MTERREAEQHGDERTLDALLHRLADPRDLTERVRRAIDAATGEAPRARRTWLAAALMAAALFVTILVAVSTKRAPRDAKEVHAQILDRLDALLDREYRVTGGAGLSGRIVARGRDHCFIEMQSKPFGRARMGIDGDRAWFAFAPEVVHAGNLSDFGRWHPITPMTSMFRGALVRMGDCDDLEQLAAGDGALVLHSARLRCRIEADGSGDLRSIEAPWFAGRMRIEWVRDLTLPAGWYAHENHHGSDAKVIAPTGFPEFTWPDWLRWR